MKMHQLIKSIDNEYPTKEQKKKILKMVCQNCYKKFNDGNRITYVVLDDGIHAWHRPSSYGMVCTNKNYSQ